MSAAENKAVTIEAEHLYIAIKIADALADNDPEDINTIAALVPRYKEMRSVGGDHDNSDDIARG